MPEPDERLAPAPPEVRPAPEAEGIPSGWRALAPDLTPLRRHRDYRLLTLGQSVSFFGSMITFVAVPYQVFQLTGSSLAVGLLGVVQMAALLALAFLGGALADAVDRRRLVLLSDLGLMMCSGGLLANALLGSPRTWVVFALAGAAAGLGAIQRPALGAMVPRAGAAASLVGVRASVVSGGVLCVLAVAATAAALPAFWSYDARAPVES